MPSEDVLPAGLAERWYEYWQLSSGSRTERKQLALGRPADVVRAHDQVAAQVEAGGSAAVEWLVSLAEAAPAGDDGMAVGAGPLEDLLHEHGAGVMGDVVTRARQSPAFRRALSHAILPRDLP